MTKFNPHNKKVLTTGEALDPAMGITEKGDAVQYLVEYTTWLEESGVPNARSVAKQNIAYYSGYCSTPTQERMTRLFDLAT